MEPKLQSILWHSLYGYVMLYIIPPSVKATHSLEGRGTGHHFDRNHPINLTNQYPSTTVIPCTYLIAGSLHGRSLTEVINAARKASLDEQPKRSSKSPASINETYQSSNPHSRRMSFDDPSAASLGHSEPNHPRLSSAGSRADYFSDPHYTYGGLVDLK
ncbi:hypothetical protein PGTUg99_031863 [Puccinia graminis f. sp. tritici]|uniref:Uncharacterized protein n=1 Tax=Puccinia graminis f. sp. tritici TaxID=56615 RepID=A0A5B0Q897_PUCGR|nr:hypothetical protein PGTUg99_031863 [Puccinia graminis f. sp. tritici]